MEFEEARSMDVKEAIRRAKLMLACKETAASLSDYFGRREDASMHRNDIAALETLIDIAERWKADAD